MLASLAPSPTYTNVLFLVVVGLQLWNEWGRVLLLVIAAFVLLAYGRWAIFVIGSSTLLRVAFLEATTSRATTLKTGHCIVGECRDSCAGWARFGLS
jgi:uncharacterized membrane protein YpjA